jgi:cytochrome c-type biogenesis protein CcmF
MTGTLGNYGLMGAVLAAAGALVAAMAGGRFRSAAWLGAARGLVVLVAGLFSLCALALAGGILGDAFDLTYVAEYSERALPIGYKLAAFWAGQSGSLLLWGWMIAALGLVVVLGLRRRGLAEQAGAVATLAVIAGFFAGLMLLVPAANPFTPMALVEPETGETVLYTPPDGQGMNPQLQNPAMIAHPPLLFLGYAGYAITFALMIGGLVAGRLDSDWLKRVRRWALGSWVLLGLGILLGAWWAYVELGWGGYWAWDPVENASLLPWLTGTALLHTMTVQRYRGTFKGLSVGLIALTFVLCLFGTYLTRSGAAQSVHSFGHSEIGAVLLVFLIAAGAAGAVLMVVRRKALGGGPRAVVWGGREWVFFAVAAMLVMAMLVTAAGTLFPIVAAAGGARVAVEQEFYNHYVLEWLGLPLLALMALGPLVAFGRRTPASTHRTLFLAGAGGLLAVSVAASLGLRSAVMLVATAIGAAAVTVIVAGWGEGLLSGQGAAPTDLRSRLRRLLGAGGGRLGAQLAHLGILAVMFGIVGSGLFGTEQVVRLPEGQPVPVGRYTLSLKGTRDVRAVNYVAAEAAVEVSTSDGPVATLRPQLRQYDKSPDMVSSEIALESGWREDLYLAMSGVDETDGAVFVKVLTKPLLAWIWIGGLILTLGGLAPRLLAALWRPLAAASEDPAEVQRLAAVGAGRKA